MVTFCSYTKTFYYTFFSSFSLDDFSNWYFSPKIGKLRTPLHTNRVWQRPLSRFARPLSPLCRRARELRTYEKQKNADKDAFRTCRSAFGRVGSKRSGSRRQAATSEILKRSAATAICVRTNSPDTSTAGRKRHAHDPVRRRRLGEKNKNNSRRLQRRRKHKYLHVR